MSAGVQKKEGKFLFCTECGYIYAINQIFYIMKTKILLFLSVFIFICFGCNDDEDNNTFIALESVEDNNELSTYDNGVITLYFPSSKVSEFLISGGSGNFTVETDNFLLSCSVDGNHLILDPLKCGEADFIITDEENLTSLKLKVNCTYWKESFVNEGNNIKMDVVYGDSLKSEEIETIRNLALSKIPVQEGGRYEFTYHDSNRTKGDVKIYDANDNATEGTFSIRSSEGSPVYCIDADRQYEFYLIEENDSLYFQESLLPFFLKNFPKLFKLSSYQKLEREQN